jgi:hypothetical protein
VSAPNGRENLSLRDNAFERHVAGMAKHGLAVALHVLVEPDAGPSLGQGPSEAFGESPTQRKAVAGFTGSQKGKTQGPAIIDNQFVSQRQR